MIDIELVGGPGDGYTRTLSGDTPPTTIVIALPDLPVSYIDPATGGIPVAPGENPLTAPLLTYTNAQYDAPTQPGPGVLLYTYRRPV